MLSEEDRVELRRQALRAWGHARMLVAASDDARTEARGLRSASVEARLQAVHLRSAEVARVDRVVVEHAEVTFKGARPAVPGVGLVVAGRVERLGQLNDTLHERVGRVFSARDPAIALGLAIIEQPDLTVLDDDLPVMSGLNTAVLIRRYAPATSVLLLTDDVGAATAASREGLAVTGRSEPPEGLQGLLDGLVA